MYNDPVTMKIDPHQIKIADLRRRVRAGLRWFAMGLSAYSVVDKFIFYWIALEMLVSDIVPSQKRFFRCRKCGHEIQHCPSCGSSTMHRPTMTQKIRTLLMAMGRTPELFDQLWQTRQMFHGRAELASLEEVEAIAKQVGELKGIVVKALKANLGIPDMEPPYSPSNISIIWGMGVEGYEEVQ
jgi:hypothetical protein